MEQWLPYPGNPDYEVSTGGQVRTLKRGSRARIGEDRILTPGILRNGYAVVWLCDGKGRERCMHVARMVLETFVGPPPEGYEVDHIDFNRTNNRLENLRWVTRVQNSHHTRDAGRIPHGEGHTRANISDAIVSGVLYGLAVSGYSQAQMCRMYDLSRQRVSDLWHGLSWKHVVAPRAGTDGVPVVCVSGAYTPAYPSGAY